MSIDLLFNVFPCQSMNYAINAILRYFEFPRNIPLIPFSSFMYSPYFYYLGIREKRNMLVDGPVSSFLNHIKHIIFACSKKQMFRIYARRVITFMKDAKPFWNKTIVNFPRKTMCINSFFVINKSAIAKFIYFTYPNTTFLRRSHQFPEWFIYFHSRIIQNLRVFSDLPKCWAYRPTL